MDAAASEFYDHKSKLYDLNFKEENNDGSGKVTGEQLMKLYESFIEEYPIVLIEDPFDQDDWEHFSSSQQPWVRKLKLWVMICWSLIPSV
jgi:enolase